MTPPPLLLCHSGQSGLHSVFHSAATLQAAFSALCLSATQRILRQVRLRLPPNFY